MSTQGHPAQASESKDAATEQRSAGASLHDPVRGPDETQAQYRARLKASREIAKRFATGFRTSDYFAPEPKRTVSHRQEKRARMAPRRALRDAAKAEREHFGDSVNRTGIYTGAL